MQLNIYKSQTEVEKTYETEAYDVMYGTLMDVFEILDQVTDLQDDMALMKVITSNRETLNLLLLDIFPGLTRDELKRTKVKELVPVIAELFGFVAQTFAKRKN